MWGYNVPENIFIKTFGSLEISTATKSFTVDEHRSPHIYIVLEHLILNRNKDISSEELKSILWGDEEIQGPDNALKNIIYRLRNSIAEKLEDQKTDYILYRKGGYCWNSSLNTTIDCEQLEKYYALGNNIHLTSDIRIRYLNMVVETFKDTFLPFSQNTDLVLELRNKYEKIYLDSVYQIIAVLFSGKNYIKIIEICTSAIKIFKDNKNLIGNLILANYADKCDTNVIEFYEINYVENTQEIDTEMDDKIKEAYKKAKGAVSPKKDGAEIVDIKSMLEDNEPFGAYYCEYDVFKSFYRIQQRNSLRTNDPISLIVVSIKTEHTENLEQYMDIMRNCCIKSLRRGDAISRFNVNQFIILVYKSKTEDTNIITNRLSKNFFEIISQEDALIDFKIQEINNSL